MWNSFLLDILVHSHNIASSWQLRLRNDYADQCGKLMYAKTVLWCARESKLAVKRYNRYTGNSDEL